MKPTSWYFVQDHDGLILAAFPERDLAESYMDDMPWEIEERIMSTDSTFVSATLYDETLRRAEKAEAENRALTAANESLKQSHLCDLDRRVNIGRSLREREADLTALRARLAEVELELARVKANDERQWKILEDCKKQLLLSDQSHSLLPERIAILQACLLSEKRAKIERGDMLVEAERERDEAQVEASSWKLDCEQLRADLAAAREDTARLDWLEQQVHKGFYNHTTGRTELTAWSCHDVKANGIRASIDSARAGGAGK